MSSLFFQSTRAQRAERLDKDKDKDKEVPQEQDEHPEGENHQILQTREQLKAAQAAIKKKAKAQQKADEESAQLVALLDELRQKTEAANASKHRADQLRQQLMEVQENDEIEEEDESDEVPTPSASPNPPISRADIGSIVAEMLQKTVLIIAYI